MKKEITTVEDRRAKAAKYHLEYYYRNREKINNSRRARNNEWMRRWVKNNPELARNKKREWNAKHPGKSAEHLRKHYRKHRATHMEKVRLWMGKNKDRVRGYMRKSMKRQCDELTDYYVRSKLTRDGMIKRVEWPVSLVELKRAQLKLTRLCRKSQTTTN